MSPPHELSNNSTSLCTCNPNTNTTQSNPHNPHNCPHCQKSDQNSSFPDFNFKDSDKLWRIITASSKGFAIGAGLKGGLALFSILSRLKSRWKSSGNSVRKIGRISNGEAIILAAKETLRYGLFLGSFAGTFVSVDECIAYLGGHKRTAYWRALLAGAIAGPSMLLTGTNTQHTSLAIYILMRAAVLASRCGIKSKRFGGICKPLTWKHGDIFLMCLSSSQIFDNFEANDEIMEGYYDVIERMVPSRTERRKIDAQLDKFKSCEGAFGRESAVDARTAKQSAYWWESFGNHCPDLQRVAIRILSLITSSTGCERNWSTFEQIHTKRRNKLEQKRMNALVFVKYNLALEQRQSHREQGTDPICLDELDDDNEWIVEKEVPILPEVPVVPEETTWLDIIDCFVENEGETSRKRRPRNLNKPLPSAKGKNVVVEDVEGDDDMEDDIDDMDDADMAAIEDDI